MPAEVRIELDRLIAAFFQAVSFEESQSPQYQEIHPLFIERGLLIRNIAEALQISSVTEFIAPREAMLKSGELSQFHEVELSETTQIFGNVAQRFSVYAKSGILKGVPFEARGMITTQFILTPQGWKISSMAWDDERPGLSIADAA